MAQLLPADRERIEEFLTLLPVTAAIAGLPTADHGKYFNEDQMELRAQNLKRAYKFALALAKELAAESPPG